MRMLAICACGLLVLVPLAVCVSLLAQFNPLPTSEVPVLSILLAAWALVSFYLMLDSRRLVRMLGRARSAHTDPAQVLVAVLGLVNFLTCVVVLVLSSFH